MRNKQIDVGTWEVVGSTEVLVVILSDERACKLYRVLRILPPLPVLTVPSSLGRVAVLTPPTLPRESWPQHPRWRAEAPACQFRQRGGRKRRVSAFLCLSSPPGEGLALGGLCSHSERHEKQTRTPHVSQAEVQARE